MKNQSAKPVCNSILSFFFFFFFMLSVNSESKRISDSSCDFADHCEDIIEYLVPAIQEDCNSSLEYLTVTTCLESASPDPQAACVAEDGATVWFQIMIVDPAATKLITHVDAPGFDAVWTVYEGADCHNKLPIGEQYTYDDGSIGVFECSNSDGDANNIFRTTIDPQAYSSGIFYFVSVTAIGEITNYDFEFSYNTTPECLACGGQDFTDGKQGEFTASIRKNGEWSEVDDNFQFCPGMNVQVCFDGVFDSGGDWFHGFVPTFGSGWEMDDDILSSSTPYPDFCLLYTSPSPRDS